MRSQSSIILLSTAIVLIEDRNNKSHKCRALLDAGSMNSYITSSFFQKITSTAESRKYNRWRNWSNFDEHQTGRPGKHQVSVQ
jgi:hypothetical protein